MAEIQFSETVQRFGALAQRYCDLIDNAAGCETMDFLLRVYRILPNLIAEAIRLPDTDPWRRNEDDDPKEEVLPNVSIGVEEWKNRYESLKQKLGNSDLYWTVFDPTKDNEVIRGTIADDLGDIYRDLKEPLLLAQIRIRPEVVIWEWRFGFYSHWGDHAISALRTIHCLLGEGFQDGESA
jgi:hypothetical protein